MQPSPVQVALFFLGVLGALAVSVITTAWLIEQYRRGREVLPYQARRPVPWRGGHVLLLALMFLLAPSLVHEILEATGWKTIILESVKNAPHPKRQMAPCEETDLCFAVFDRQSASLLAKNSFRRDWESQIFFGETPSGPSSPQPEADAQTEQEQGHEIEQLLRQTESGVVWLLAALMALIAAPLIEEWLFRGVLQGWLEKVERGLFRRMRWYARMRAIALGEPLRPKAGWRELWWSGKLLGAAPVAASSLLFAGLHVRLAGPPTPAEELLLILVCQGLGNLLSFGAGIFFLTVACGAKAADFGFFRPNVSKDVAPGLLAYLVVVGPIYAVMILTKIFLLLFGADQIAPDPAPLFLLSLVLGLLYFRTHRLLPCLVLHMAFNATGLAIFWTFS